MSKNLFNVRLFSSLLFAGALVTAGCTDNDYDFDQIDSTVGIGGEGLEIPTSSTEEIRFFVNLGGNISSISVCIK